MREWQECRLGEAITLKRGYDLPKQHRENGTVPIYSSSGITDFHRIAKVKGPGVITGRYGTIGEVFFSHKDFWPLNTSLYVEDFKMNDYRFVYYILMNFDFEEFNDKSVVPGINRNHLHTAQIILPPLPEQRAIAGVLSSLDDKIDLLHRQNKTLEGMAEALWWKVFVDEADPGWDEKGLDEIATFLNGLPCQKFPPDTSTEPLPVIKIKELRTGITADSDLATSKVPPDYIVDDGDILFSWSGSLEIVIWSFGKGVLNQHLFKVTSADYPKWFCYYWIKHHLSEFRDIAQDKATTMGHIQRHHLSDAKVLIPDQKSFQYLNIQIGPIFEKMIHNLKAIRRFARLRDTLLPKLMSGEVKVKL